MAKTQTVTTRVEFDATLPGYAADVLITFDRRTEFCHSYENADADGRRGVWEDSIKVDDYANVTVNDVSSITLDKATFISASAAVEAYMQANEPEMQQPEADDEPADYEPYYDND